MLHCRQHAACADGVFLRLCVPDGVPERYAGQVALGHFLLSACLNFRVVCWLSGRYPRCIRSYPTLQLIMMQSTGFWLPQNQMQPYVKPLRYPNLLLVEQILTLNFHHQ